MINFYKWGISVNIIEPLGREKTRIRFISLPIKGNKQSSGDNNSVDHIELEDQKVVLDVQKGIKSKFYDKGRYSVEHEKGTHYFHKLLVFLESLLAEVLYIYQQGSLKVTDNPKAL